MSECRIPVGFLNPNSRRPVATSEPHQTGYDDALFVNPPSPSLGLHCPICYLILKEPHLLSCCGKHMCQSCLQRVTAMGPQTCPCCRSEGFQAMLNKEKQATIKGLTVRCMNEAKGCDWTGELGYCQEHLEKRCQYVEIPCQYGCGEKCLRSFITGHENDQCINRPVEVKLESFMRQVTEKIAVQEREMATYKREITELKEQLKKHESNKKKLELDAQKMKQQIGNLESKINSMLKSDCNRIRTISTEKDTSSEMIPQEDDGYQRNKLVVRNIPREVDEAFLGVFLAGQLDLEEEDFSVELRKDHACLILNKEYKLEELECFCKAISSEKFKDHILAAELCRISVVASDEMPEDDDGYERDKLVIRNISQNVDDLYLGVFLAGQLDLDEDEFSIELKKSNALLTFNKEYKLKELKAFSELVSGEKLKDQILTAELCHVNCTILITEIAIESASQDGLWMYFRTKKSGGGPDAVKNIVIMARKSARVTFNKPEVVESVLSKKHSILGPRVQMVACSPLVALEEEINEPPVCFPKSNKKVKRSPVTISLDPYIAKYLGNNPDILKGISREVNASVQVVDRNKGTIKLLSNDVDGSTNDNPNETILSFQSLVSSTITRTDIQVPPEIAGDVTKLIVQFSSVYNLPFNIGQDNTFTIAGKPDMITGLQENILNLYERTVQKSDQMNLSPEDFVFFKKYALSQVKKAHPNVKMEINDQTSVLFMSGSKHDVTCFTESFQSLIDHAKVPVPLTKLIIQFLSDGKGAGILQTLIKSNSVVPFFDLTQDTFLFLLCPHSEAQYAESVATTIATSIVEKEFNFPPYFFTNVADSPQFSSFTQKMHMQYAFHCVVEGGNVFKLVCRQDILDKLSGSLEAFVSKELNWKPFSWKNLN